MVPTSVCCVHNEGSGMPITMRRVQNEGSGMVISVCRVHNEVMDANKCVPCA